MTQPIEPQPDAPAFPNFVVSGQLAPGPDGRSWGHITIQHGLAGFTFVVNEKGCTELAQIFPRVLNEVAAHVRRANLGLILPNGAGPGVAFPPKGG